LILVVLATGFRPSAAAAAAAVYRTDDDDPLIAYLAFDQVHVLPFPRKLPV